MAKEFLDRSNIGASLQGMSGETVPESMAADIFDNPNLRHRSFDGPVHG